MFDINKILNDFNSTISDCFLKKVTGDLKDFNDDGFVQVLSAMYDHKDSNNRRMATIFNSIFTHQTTTFMLTYSTAKILFEEDRNLGNTKYGSLNSKEYKLLICKMLESGYFKEIEKQIGRKSAVYELTEKTFVQALTYKCGSDTLKAKKKKVQEFYHKEAEPQQEQEQDQESVGDALRRNLRNKGVKI